MNFFFAWTIFVGCVLINNCQGSSETFEEVLRLIFWNDFGYTLIGEKPISLYDSYSEYLTEFFPHDVEKARVFLKSTFQNSDRFILREINGRLWLIDKPSLHNQILKNRILRSYVIKKFGSEAKFIVFLKSSNENLFEALDHRIILLAIALGYGEENGEFFIRRIELGRYLQKYPFVGLYPFDGFPAVDKVRNRYFYFDSHLKKIDTPKICSDFPSLEEEWLWMKQVNWPLYLESEPDPPYYISLPTYIARHGSESEAIHDRFLKARDKLATLFCGRKFSEIIAEEASKKKRTETP